MLLRSQVIEFSNRVLRSKGGLWVAGLFLPKHQNVLAVRTRQRGGCPPEKELFAASNIVTDEGDKYYAELSNAGGPAENFAILELASAGTPGKAADRSAFTVIGSTQKPFDSGYPKTNDDDTDNATDADVDVVSYRVSYTKTDFNHGAITHGLITNITPGASEPILTGFAFSASFAKTADDTLKVFVNHEMTGV